VKLEKVFEGDKEQVTNMASLKVSKMTKKIDKKTSDKNEELNEVLTHGRTSTLLALMGED
jgi:hypothetical protein